MQSFVILEPFLQWWWQWASVCHLMFLFDRIFCCLPIVHQSRENSMLSYIFQKILKVVCINSSKTWSRTKLRKQLVRRKERWHWCRRQRRQREGRRRARSYKKLLKRFNFLKQSFWRFSRFNYIDIAKEGRDPEKRFVFEMKLKSWRHC